MNPSYCGVLLEQHLILNRKRGHQDIMKKEIEEKTVYV